MKTLQILLVLLPAARLVGGPMVVFGEKDFYDLHSSPTASGPTDAGRRTFFDAYRKDREMHAAYENSMELVNPPAWGKTLGPQTRGRIQFHPSFPGGFACRIALEGLQPGHDYILTLNGNPARPGNDLLLSAVPGNEQERYYDFLIVRSDAHGRYDENFGIFLKPGQYEVRCYVKDTSDFKIVLYRDFFGFAVKESSGPFQRQ